MTSSVIQGHASDSVQLNHWKRSKSVLLAGCLYLCTLLLIHCPCHAHALARDQRTSHGWGDMKGQHGGAGSCAALCLPFHKSWG